jgi:DNA-binding IclR family transcriptional regulator
MGVISARDGERMLLMRLWQPSQSPAVWLEPGQRIPVYGSAAGMAVLGAMPDETFEDMLPDGTLRRFRQQAFEQLVVQGFAIPPVALRYAGSLSAVSVPYFAGDFGAHVAFSCKGLPAMLPDVRMREEVGPALRDLVRELEKRTGEAPALARRG